MRLGQPCRVQSKTALCSSAAHTQACMRPVVWDASRAKRTIPVLCLRFEEMCLSAVAWQQPSSNACALAKGHSPSPAQTHIRSSCISPSSTEVLSKASSMRLECRALSLSVAAATCSLSGRRSRKIRTDSANAVLTSRTVILGILQDISCERLQPVQRLEGKVGAIGSAAPVTAAGPAKPHGRWQRFYQPYYHSSAASSKRRPRQATGALAGGLKAGLHEGARTITTRL